MVSLRRSLMKMGRRKPTQFEKLPDADNVHSQLSPERLLHRQQAFGVSSEEVNDIILTLAQTGYEPLGSIGADWPVAVLSQQSQHLQLHQAVVCPSDQPTDRPDP